MMYFEDNNDDSDLEIISNNNLKTSLKIQKCYTSDKENSLDKNPCISSIHIFKQVDWYGFITNITYEYGLLHSINDNPAVQTKERNVFNSPIETNVFNMYYEYGKLSRRTGPAVETTQCKVGQNKKMYYLDGIEYSECEWKNALRVEKIKHI